MRIIIFNDTPYATKAGFQDSDIATLEFTMSGDDMNMGDVNGDGEVGIGDIVTITNIMANN